MKQRKLQPFHKLELPTVPAAPRVPDAGAELKRAVERLRRKVKELSTQLISLKYATGAPRSQS